MKHILSILFLLTIGFTACQRNTTYPLAMQQAEELMKTRPDSALHLLEDMADSLIMLSNEAQMYYHLLTIQAKDKQYITHTSDSLINRIVSYYEESGDKERLMMAYYYQGSTYRDMNDAPRALKAFQQVLDLNVPNLDLLAKTYNQMGTLFMYQGLHDEVIQVNRKAIESYILQGKRSKISYFQRDIARMYSAKNIQDSAILYYKKAYQTALTDGDSARCYGILSEIGGYFYEIGMTDSAKQILLFTEKQNKISNKSHIYTMLGHIYKNELKLDSARYYYQESIICGDIHQKYNSYKYLFMLKIPHKNDTKAFEYIKKALALKDSIDIITKTEAITQMNSLYNYQHTEMENVQLKLVKEKQKNWILFLSLFIILILFTIAFIGLNQIRKKEHKHLMDEFKKSNLYKEIWQASIEEDNFTVANSPEKWISIQNNIDSIHPGFTDKLYRITPPLTSTELKVCLLTKIGFPPSGIARVLNLSKQAISNARSKLFKKMLFLNENAKNFNDLIDIL